MTISSSLNAGVAGLNANANRLATISDNIANASTFGYKRVQTDFQSMVISSGSASGKYSAGGVSSSTQRLVDERGSLVTTSNPTDLAVRGRGFLPVAKSSEVEVGNGNSEMLLTTTGSFRTDKDGYLRTNGGLVLLGWPANPDGSIPSFPRDTAAGLEPVRINVNQLTGEPTTRVDLGLNLPATASGAGLTAETQTSSIEYFDNLGTSQTLTIEFTPTIPGAGLSNQWTMVITDSAQPGPAIGEYVLDFSAATGNGGNLTGVGVTTGGAYVAATGEITVPLAGGGAMTIDIGRLNENDGITQLADDFRPLSISKDGSPVGVMTSVEVDENGFVFAFFETGISRRIFQVPLVDLPNPNGLVAGDQQTYTPSPESGTFYLWDAADGPTGDIIGFALEESTVDVASELTSLIQTQRAYSSNAKVIQTVDEMLQETTNIKR
ncbi:flagellar hook protein FlgE [Primorskyibacter sp. S187A]|uniref:flagellar hook protein FlgE n=1 Tax=Primorskyibacter sp. S187A TaxID=3415130 RepID=UPI003C7DFC9F